MKILFVGDVVGSPGRRILSRRLQEVQRRQDIDFTIVNVENAAGGYGITPSIAEEILEAGADVMTSGNHIWDKKEVLGYIDNQPLLLRPGNYPPGTPGAYSVIAPSRSGAQVAVINLQGRVFMPIIDCPFQMARREIPRLRKEAQVVIVDFHAEATSEKIAFGWFLDGQVTAVLGTHTHVPTADARILPQGTAYISDVGMTGPVDSVIGMKVEASLNRFLTALRQRFEVAKGPTVFSSVVLDVDETSGKAHSIHRMDLREE